MKKDALDKLIAKTNNVSLIWKNVHGIASECTASKMDKAMLDWQYELTKTLRLWFEKGTSMTTGELILARANLGAVVESWLRFFYCVYYEEYSRQPKVSPKGKKLEPEKDMRFEDLKNYSTGILWDDNKSDDYLWVESVQHKRNAIHSFTYKDIGNPKDFLHDVDKLCDFVNLILNHLPPLEDYLESYPYEYDINLN